MAHVGYMASDINNMYIQRRLGTLRIQWNPSIADTIGNQHLRWGVPNSEASGINPVGVKLRNQAVEHSVAVFSLFRAFPCCMLAGKAKKEEASTMSNGANLMSSC